MADDKIYQNLKRLKNYSEWKVFADHVKAVAEVHKETSVGYLALDKVKDAQRQSWIIEGLLEAIGEPDSIVSEVESMKGKISLFCNLCGQKLKEVFMK